MSRKTDLITNLYRRTPIGAVTAWERKPHPHRGESVWRLV